MATKFKIAYDSTAKGNLAPIGNEEQKALVLQLDPKSEETKVHIGGLAWCGVVDGSHWIIGCDKTMGLMHTNLFFSKKVGEKWEKDANLEKAFHSSYEANKYCYALNVDGHAGCEALVKALDGKYVDSDFDVLTDDGDKVTKSINALLADESDDTLDFSDVFSAIFSVLSKDEFTSQKDRKKNTVPYPLLGEDGKPSVIAFLPKIKASGKGYAAKATFLSTLERLNDAVALKGNDSFESLFAWYQSEPQKVALALALTGVAITLPSIEVKPTVLSVTTEEKEPSKAVEENPESIANFVKVYDKEKGNEDDTESFSSDALSAISNPDEDDAYKQTLLQLADYTINGKAFPFGVTKQKLGVSGSVFKLSLAELQGLAVKANL